MSADPTLRDRLAQSLGPVLASDLAAHLRRDAVLVVDPALDLLDCAEAVAADRSVQVRAWLERGALRRASPQERADWPQQAAFQWMAVIVQPFVLVQLLAGPEA